MISPARKNAAPTQPTRRRGSLDQVLIDAAMDLFASYGYRGTSLARIARAAGVTKGALYWHFADKEEFFIAVVAKVLGEWELIFEKSARATNTVEFRAEFERMFDTMAALNEKNPWVSRAAADHRARIAQDWAAGAALDAQGESQRHREFP